MKRLGQTTVEHVRKWKSNIKGHDVDEASLASIGFETRKFDRNAVFAETFPAELKAAYLVYAFEQWRMGRNIPVPRTIFEGPYTFSNGEVKTVLSALEWYLTYYENEAKKENPRAVLLASTLIGKLQKYVLSKTE